MDKGIMKGCWNAIKVILAIVVFIGGIAAALYYGLWVMFIRSILTACAAFDAGTLTATIVGMTVIKCILASTVAWIIFMVSCTITKWLCK